MLLYAISFVILKLKLILCFQVMSKGMQGYKKQILTECKIRSREIISKLKTRHNEISEEFLKVNDMENYDQ